MMYHYHRDPFVHQLTHDEATAMARDLRFHIPLDRATLANITCAKESLIEKRHAMLCEAHEIKAMLEAESELRRIELLLLPGLERKEKKLKFLQKYYLDSSFRPAYQSKVS
jgi:hypothetical protein